MMPCSASSSFFGGEPAPHRGLEYVLQRFYSSMRFRNESVFTRIFLKRSQGKRREKIVFTHVDGALEAHAHRDTHPQTDSQTHTHTHTRTNTHTFTSTHPQTKTHTPTHYTCTHTNTHTHTHTHSFQEDPSPSEPQIGSVSPPLLTQQDLRSSERQVDKRQPHGSLLPLV